MLLFPCLSTESPLLDPIETTNRELYPPSRWNMLHSDSLRIARVFRDKDYLIKIGAKEFANTPMDIFDILQNK